MALSLKTLAAQVIPRLFFLQSSVVAAPAGTIPFPFTAIKKNTSRPIILGGVPPFIST